MIDLIKLIFYILQKLITFKYKSLYIPIHHKSINSVQNLRDTKLDCQQKITCVSVVIKDEMQLFFVLLITIIYRKLSITYNYKFSITLFWQKVCKFWQTSFALFLKASIYLSKSCKKKKYLFPNIYIHIFNFQIVNNFFFNKRI